METPKAAPAKNEEIIVVSALGLGQWDKATERYTPYGVTEYIWEDKPHPTSFSALAIQKLFPATRCHFLATSKALTSPNYEALKVELSEDVLARSYSWIPDGKNKDELWQTFNIMEAAIPYGSSIILDVTYGFRHLPILNLAIALYLQTVKNVMVKKIVYAQYVGKTQTEIVDMTPFLDLVEWTQAVSQFNQTGRGDGIQKILEGIQSGQHRGQPKTKRKKVAVEDNGVWLPESLIPLGLSLQDLGASLQTNRPDVGEKASQLLVKMDNQQKETLEGAAHPLRLITAALRETFEPLAETERHSLRGLKAQVKTIEWYVERQLYVQAICLIREWLVSYRCSIMGLSGSNKDDRTVAENTMNDENTLYVKIKKKEVNQALPDGYDTELLKLWDKVVELRNDVLHYGEGREKGHNKALPANAAIKGVKTITKELEQFANKIKET